MLLVCVISMPKWRPFQVTSWPDPIRPDITPEIARSPVQSVDAMCRSMLRARSKTRSMGAAILVRISRRTMGLVKRRIRLLYRKSRRAAARLGRPRAAVPTSSRPTRRLKALQPRALLRDHLPDLLHELLDRHVLGLFFAAGPYIHSSGFSFLIAHHELEGDFLHRMLANLRVHLLVARVHIYPHTDCLQLRCDFVRIVRMPFGDRNHHSLHR